MDPPHPLYEVLFRWSPWIILPGALLLVFLGRAFLNSVFLYLARPVVAAVERINEFIAQR
jgi:hypothetical protein